MIIIILSSLFRKKKGNEDEESNGYEDEHYESSRDLDKGYEESGYVNMMNRAKILMQTLRNPAIILKMNMSQLQEVPIDQANILKTTKL